MECFAWAALRVYVSVCIQSDATSQPLVVNQDKTAIQPAHVREALRRYHNNIGPLIPFAVSETI